MLCSVAQFQSHLPSAEILCIAARSECERGVVPAPSLDGRSQPCKRFVVSCCARAHACGVIVNGMFCTGARVCVNVRGLSCALLPIDTRVQAGRRLSHHAGLARARMHRDCEWNVPHATLHGHVVAMLCLHCHSRYTFLFCPGLCSYALTVAAPPPPQTGGSVK